MSTEQVCRGWCCGWHHSQSQAWLPSAAMVQALRAAFAGGASCVLHGGPGLGSG